MIDHLTKCRTDAVCGKVMDDFVAFRKGKGKQMFEDREAIQTLTEFIAKVEIFDMVISTPLFRGQDRRGNLLPNMVRDNPEIDSSASERFLLNQLRLQGASLFAAPLSDLDLLIQAQHFCLRTRLLDWTSNPLVALWFACNSTRDAEDVFVYALEADSLLDEVLPTDPFKPALTRVVQPPMNNPRIIAQQGWFTLHNFSKKAKRFVPLERNSNTVEKLHEFLIEGTMREHLLAELDRVGISARTLFPDLPGLCRHLNWKYRRHHLPTL